MKPHIVTVSGPSLSGKTEFTKILQKEHGFNSIVSVTTRPQRGSEIDGLDYHFITPEAYAKLTLIQKTDYNNFQYGVSEEEVISKKEHPILWVVAPQSVSQIEKYCHQNDFNLTKIFITNPKEIIFERLFSRFKNDEKGSVSTYVNRLNAIINIENEWVIEATNPETSFKYDLIYTSFDNTNTQEVVNKSVEHVNLKNNNVKKNKMK